MTILHASLGNFLLVDATGSDYERVIVVSERTRLHNTFTTPSRHLHNLDNSKCALRARILPGRADICITERASAVADRQQI
jgi:hypothetical protein